MSTFIGNIINTGTPNDTQDGIKQSKKTKYCF